MAKKKDKKKKIKKTDYKKKYKKLKIKYKKLKAKIYKISKKKKTIGKPKLLNDNSSNYNAKEAILKLRSITNMERLNKFTESEKRVTVLKALQSRKNAIK